METPFFTVVVPVYKAEAYLEACLETLAGQSFAQYEVILVDDGSPDNSGAICDAWQLRYPHMFRVIHQKNGGQVMARMAAVWEAKGEFLVFVDSDDMLRTDALEIIAGYIRRYQADMVIYNLAVDPDYSKRVGPVLFEDGQVVTLEHSDKLRKLLCGSFALNSMCRKAVRRCLVRSNWDFSSVAHIRNGEDLLQSLPIMESAKRIVYADQNLYFYRENPQSVTNVPNPRLFRSLRDVLRIQRQYAEKWDATGQLSQLCDTHGLLVFFDDVIVKICRSPRSWKEKRNCLLEVVTDADFLRDYAYLRRIPSAKARLSLALARHRCFLPLLLYGTLRNEL